MLDRFTLTIARAGPPISRRSVAGAIYFINLRIRIMLSIPNLLLWAGLCSFCNNADTVIIRKDPRFDVLAQKQAQFNRRAAMITVSGQYRGYRVQLASTTNREEATRAKSDILSKHPDEKAYLFYSSPYFKVRIGNFIKKEDAEKFRKSLAKHYQKAVYVVEDEIEYSMKDTDPMMK